MKQIKIQCPAKINLTLKITGKRADGFHELDSIMQTISLFDYLTIAVESSDELRIDLNGTSDEIPYNEKNLVYKAGMLFFEKIYSNENYPPLEGGSENLPHPNPLLKGEGAVVQAKRATNAGEVSNNKFIQTPQGEGKTLDTKFKISVFIEKNIPVAAGLAGGSTDAAGMLYGLNKLFNEPLTREELHELCAQLGSDLNLCLEGGRQRTTGRGEILEQLPFEEFNVSLIKPLNLGISAKEAYTKFSKKIKDCPQGEGKFYSRDDYVNDLEWAVIEDYEELQKIKTRYPKSIMSGSGSTYFGINLEFDPQEGYWVKNNLTSLSFGVKEV